MRTPEVISFPGNFGAGSVAVAQAVQSYGRDNDDASDDLAVFEPREFIDAGEHVTVSMIERSDFDYGASKTA